LLVYERVLEKCFWGTGKSWKVPEIFLNQRVGTLTYTIRHRHSWRWLFCVVAGSDHTLHDCVGVGVLSHGTHRGQLYGVDGQLITVTGLLTPLKHCASLVGKPKIVIVEVSRSFYLYTIVCC